MRNRHVPQHRSRVRILRQEMSFRYLAVGLLLVVLLSLVSGNSRARDEDEVALAYPVPCSQSGSMPCWRKMSFSPVTWRMNRRSTVWRGDTGNRWPDRDTPLHSITWGYCMIPEPE